MSQKLIDYIKKNKEKGHHPDKIRKALIDHWIKEQLVDEAFKKAEGREEDQPSIETEPEETESKKEKSIKQPPSKKTKILPLFLVLIPLFFIVGIGIGVLIGYGLQNDKESMIDNKQSCWLPEGFSCKSFAQADGKSVIEFTNELPNRLSNVVVSVETKCLPENVNLGPNENLKFNCLGISKEAGKKFSMPLTISAHNVELGNDIEMIFS